MTGLETTVSVCWQVQSIQTVAAAAAECVDVGVVVVAVVVAAAAVGCGDGGGDAIREDHPVDSVIRILEAADPVAPGAGAMATHHLLHWVSSCNSSKMPSPT